MSQPGTVGALPPPPGAVPNFVNSHSEGYKVLIVGVMTWTLGTMTFCLRCVKIKITHIRRIDDWFIGIGWIFATGLTSLAFSFVYHSGLGRHAWVPLSTFNPSFLQTIIAYAILYQMSVCFIKLSILVFYLNLSPYRGFRAIGYTLIGTTIAYTIPLVFQIIFRCQPIAKAWDLTITYGHCLSVRLVSVTNGFFNAITDCIMITLPIPLTWKLRIPRRQKILIVLILMTSSFVCIVSILRLIENFQEFGAQDPTRTYVTPAIWALVEVNVGTCCACLPHLKPLLRRWIPKALGESNGVHSSIRPGIPHAVPPASTMDDETLSTIY